jgi:RNA polymerase sigma-70 factor, ECF subfamily
MATAPTKTDAALVARLQELYREYENRLSRFAYRLTGNEHDAADLVQETFVRVLVRLDRLDPDRPDLSSYLFKTAQNLFLTERTRGRRTETVEDVPEPDVPAPIEGDPQRSTLLHDQQEEVRLANGKLAPRQRLVLALCELEEKSYAEIGELVGLKENAVAQLISRARQSLRHELRLVQVDRSKLPEECQQRLPKLSAYLDGQLNGDARTQLLAHVAACQHCQAALGDMDEARRRYRALIPPIAGGVVLKEQVDDALAAEGFWAPPSGAAPRLLGPPGRRGWIAGAVAGCAVVAAIGVGVALLLTRGGEQAAVTFTPPVSTAAPPPSVSPTTAAADSAPAVAAVAETVAEPVPLAVTILDRPPERTRSTRAPFAFETGGDPTSVRCRLDDGAFEPCSSPIVYRGLDRGVHRFAVRVSASGETAPASASAEWTIVEEQGGGAATVEAAVAGGAETASPAETGPSNEAAPANEEPKDNNPDRRDEPEQQPPADTTPPAVSILGGPSGETTKTVAVFRFGADEPVSRVECSLDGGGYSRCYTPTRYDVGVGGHTFCVRAADRAGNLGGPACSSWTVAETPAPPPPTTQEQPPATTEQQGGEQQGPLGTGNDDDQRPPPSSPNCNQPAILDPC